MNTPHEVREPMRGILVPGERTPQPVRSLSKSRLTRLGFERVPLTMVEAWVDALGVRWSDNPQRHRERKRAALRCYGAVRFRCNVWAPWDVREAHHFVLDRTDRRDLAARGARRVFEDPAYYDVMQSTFRLGELSDVARQALCTLLDLDTEAGVAA